MLRIIAKALSKAPETRYQSGRELADDLLAITRPGYVPTLRARETPTLPPDAPPGDVPTISSPPTAQALPTIASAETAAKAPALAPTILTPATARSVPPPLPPPRKPPAAAAASAAQPKVAVPRRKGSGAGLIVGLGVVGLLLVALVAGGAFFLMRARTPAPVEPATADATPLPSSPPPAPADPGAQQPAEAAPATVATPSAGPAARPAPATDQRAEPAPTRPPVSAPPPTRSAATAPPPEPEPAGAEFAHLDELPSAEGDGRAAGAAAGRSYSQGGTSGFGTQRRFAARGNVPPGVTQPERPAVATLIYLNSVEGAFHRKNGRYGTLRELADAGLLALDVPFDASGFKRMRYAFRVTVEPDGYRAEAIPQAPIGRAFIVDDTGKVQQPD